MTGNTAQRAAELAAALATELAPKLALLRALGTEQHLTRAARAVGVPQPTASRWLAELGTRLGAPVLVRDGRGMRLTRAGQLLADAAGPAMAALEDGCWRAVEEIDPDAGRVVFAFLPAGGTVNVPELLREFRRRYPKVRFSLMKAGHEVMLDWVLAGTADLALTAPLPVRHPDLRQAVLRHQSLVLSIPDTHRLAGRRRVRIAELAGDEFIGFPPGYGLRTIADELCAAAGFTPRLSFVGEEVATNRGLVAAGLGVALLPPAEPAAPPGLVELPVTPNASRSIGLVWSGARPLPTAARRFRDFVTRTVAASNG